MKMTKSVKSITIWWIYEQECDT